MHIAILPAVLDPPDVEALFITVPLVARSGVSA
jgi:hypothetical protein